MACGGCERDALQVQKSGRRLGWIPARYILAILASFGFVNVYAMRVNLSVALVAMVKGGNDNSTAVDECAADNSTNSDSSGEDGEFVWDRQAQELLLGCFFYGYIVTQIPAGWMAEKFGAKKIYGIGILGTSVFTLLTPIAARKSFNVLVAVRVLEGLFEGVTFPCMHAMWAQWAPPLERSRLSVMTYAGAQLGTVISLPVSGLLAKYGFDGGWPSVFYVFGLLGVLWCILWVFLVYDSPAKHPRISRHEREYIETALGSKSRLPTVSFFKLPWLKFITSPPVLAIACVNVCNNWGFYTLLTNLPTYFKDVLRLNIQQNGLLSALPYLAMWLAMLLGGFVVDALRLRGIVRTVTARKLANGIGLMSPAICLIVVGYVGCDRVAALLLLVVAVGLSGIANSGFLVNHLDIAPKYAGTLLGITNCLGNIPGFLAPLVVGTLTEEKHTSEQWRVVFFISSAVYTFGFLVYTAFASGEVQPWATEDDGEERPLPVAGTEDD